MPSSESSQFGINNIPYGIASSGTRSSPQCVTRIGDEVIFLAELADGNIIESTAAPLSGIFRQSTLNSFAALPKGIHVQVRNSIQRAYQQEKHTHHSENIASVTLHLPIQIGDFTDFSASRDHVLNAGEAILGIRSYPPAFHKYPVGYAGRCSSIVTSGTPIDRPLGQFIEDYTEEKKTIVFGPSKALDYELEVGAIIGRPVPAGDRLKIQDADHHIFGLVLVNDWSARDIQALEMNPLGPLNGKNFATTVSPWIVTLEALKNYTTRAPPRMGPVAEFLDDADAVNYDIELAVDIIRKGSTSRTCKVGFDTMYWTFRHMLTHHAIGGCGLRTGDLIASGTVSGEGEQEHGCLLELTNNGKKEWVMTNGMGLRYLEDEDDVILSGIVGSPSDGIGFGNCTGMIVSARVL